jgi:hypothetical protein
MTDSTHTIERGIAGTRLAALAAVMIPAGHGLPDAPAAGVPGAMLDRILALRPEAGAILADAVAFRTELSPEDAVPAMAREEPALLSALFEVLAAAYYLAPAVRAGIGYSGQQALALPRGGFGAEDLVLEMMESPNRFRVPPDFVVSGVRQSDTGQSHES